MTGRLEVCDDCGHPTREHKYVAGQHLCTACYAERDEMGRQGEGLPWEPRPGGLPVGPCWRAYHLACADIGYSLRSAPTRALRDQINERWSRYMYLSAVLRDEDGFKDHRGPTAYEGPEWDWARETVEAGLSDSEIAHITGGV